MSCRCCLSHQTTSLKIERNYYLSNLDKKVHTAYKICEVCGLIYQSPYIGDEFLNNYYSSSPMLRRAESTPFEIDQNIRQTAFVKRSISVQDSSVLEIGAHAGSFLDHLRDTYNCDCSFHELSTEAADLLRSKGFHDFSFDSDKTFQLIVLRHVLEHVYDLDGFIQSVLIHLDTDGHIFIEVPDWSSYDDSLDPLIFEHINQFSSLSLLRLFSRHSLDLVSYEKSIHPEDPASPNRVQRFLLSRSIRNSTVTLSSVFNDFTSTSYDQWKNRLNDLLGNQLKDKRIALYPASHLAFDAIVDTNLASANVIGYFDIDSKKQGCSFMGLEVFPPSELATLSPDIILIFTMAYEPEIRISFEKLGLSANVISITQLVKNDYMHEISV